MSVKYHLSYSVTRKQLAFSLIIVSYFFLQGDRGPPGIKGDNVRLGYLKSFDNKDCSQLSYPCHFYPFFSFDPFIKHPPLDTQPIKCY